MKKIFTSLFCGLIGTAAFAQWTPVSQQTNKIRKDVNVHRTYKLDVDKMRTTLANAPLEGKGAKPIVVQLPDLDGTLHNFAVYSRPVAEKSLADRYGLGSYVGVGVDNPSLYARFSFAGNDFQSMLLKDGEYQFVEPLNEEKTVYGVFPKTNKTQNGKPFECSTSEEISSKKELDNFYKAVENRLENIPVTMASDRKFRTYRLALAVTGEYGALYGGADGALVQMNATMTRVNAIYEKDMALNLIIGDFPQIIYTDAATDPFSDAGAGTNGAWTLELQRTLTAEIGEANYDIGHLFGASGGGGNAGCIGCVCTSPRMDGNGIPTAAGKGAAYTSPGQGLPQGDTFDIDYVAHEFGHQLGANHTFSHALHTGLRTHVEPGSGSTIMGYAGITNANVQMQSDAYFHVVSLNEMQTNLARKECAVETPIVNNPPVIAALSDVTIPKGTAFVLTAEVTDAEDDALTYTWEQVDPATATVTSVNGLNTSGALFRSLLPTNSPTRYFPKLSSVLDGNLTIPADWETVANVARETNFRITVRDNNPEVKEQQTQSALQKVTVHDNGPFKVASTKVYNNEDVPFTWNVVGTDSAPFNVSNVKIDYTTDNGNTWVVLAESTPNDGEELFDFSTFATGDELKIRVSALGNVFYTIGKVSVDEALACSDNIALTVQASDITENSANLGWEVVKDATYILRYKKEADTDWMEINTDQASIVLANLESSSDYEVQVAVVCSGVTGAFSPLVTFSTQLSASCPIRSNNANYEHIKNVTLTPERGIEMSNDSDKSNYTDYTSDLDKRVTFYYGTTNNTISVGKGWSTASTYNEAVKVWIDFNQDGVFSDSEVVMDSSLGRDTPVTNTFAIPADAYTGGGYVRMRVILSDAAITGPCQNIRFGEVEDYAVRVINTLSTSNTVKTTDIKVHPNPAKDVLNVTNVSDNATYSIYNIAGQLVGNGKISNGKVQVSHLEKGVYIITVNQNDETAKLKFIKQ